MRRTPRIAVGLLAGVVGVVLLAASVSAIQVGEKAPDFTLAGPGNKPVKLTELLGKGPVVIYTFVQSFAAT